MINVCLNCGEYREDKRIDMERSVAICPLGEHPHPFKFLPLLIVCGPSGAGKTTLSNVLVGQMDDVVMMDGDVLYGAVAEEINFWNVWLRLAKNVHQSGRPFVLFSGGAIPPNIDPCVERRYFTDVHYLALTSDDDILAQRLRARPSWRQSGSEEFIAEHIRFNHWLQEQAAQSDSNIELLNTSAVDVDTAVEQLKMWIKSKLP